jgi:putative oxygen-independent coproporphyrinogen III oxidase
MLSQNLSHHPDTLYGTSQFPTALYIHVPFCRSRCVYCDFYLEVEKQGTQASGRISHFVMALQREINARMSHWYTQHGISPHKKPFIQSIYWGGGTPSLLTPQAIETILETLSRWVDWDASCEITLEVNPKDWQAPPKHYVAAGITRFSLGVQSLQDPLLQALSRRHRRQDVIESIHEIENSGVRSWSLDFMYGIPRQTEALWHQDVQAIVAIAPPHVSMYGLQVEENTPLPRLIQTGHYPIVDDTCQAQWYEYAQEALAQTGLQAYELSNFALAGHESLHNQVYWEQRPYGAFGPAAAGWVQGCYYTNRRDLTHYLEANWKDPANHEMPSEAWTPSPEACLEQVLIFGLRQRKGVALQKLAYGLVRIPQYTSLTESLMPLIQAEASPPSEAVLALFWQTFWQWTGEAFQAHFQAGRLRCENPSHSACWQPSLRFSTSGWLLGNTVLVSLLERHP